VDVESSSSVRSRWTRAASSSESVSGKGLQLGGEPPSVVHDGFQGRRRVRYEKASATTSLVDAVFPTLVAPPTA
jgi:hypothetical protein